MEKEKSIEQKSANEQILDICANELKKVESTEQNFDDENVKALAYGYGRAFQKIQELLQKQELSGDKNEVNLVIDEKEKMHRQASAIKTKMELDKQIKLRKIQDEKDLEEARKKLSQDIK